MKLPKLRSLHFLTLILLISSTSHLLSAPTSPEPARIIVHLLDYMAQDYSLAVKQGQIINEAEFQEMVEFSTTIEGLSREIAFKDTADSLFVFQKIEELQQSVQQKRKQEKIVSISSAVKEVIIRTTGIKVAPAEWPVLANGKTLYQQLCSSCHGENGDGNGPMANSLDPKPTSFLNQKMRGISPFQAFNTIKLGVSGTSMPAFDQLSDQEVWDLAFYVNALDAKGEDDDALAKEVIKEQKLTLEKIAFLSDNDLTNRIAGSTTEKNRAVAAIRNFPGTNLPSNSLDLARQYVQEAAQFYEQGDKKAARSKALQAYLEGIEPVELQIRASNPTFTLQLEAHMAALRKSIEQEASVAEVMTKADTAFAAIEEAASILQNNDFSFWLSFFLAASVILREGLEAFLIIVTILGIIRAANAPKAAKWVHLGWVTAVALGVCGWFFADRVINLSGMKREVLEGAIALLAAGLLLYIGFWLHSKSEIGKWNAFVKEKVHKLLHGGNMLGLAFFSFIVMFREAFESVLFLSALTLEVDQGNQPAIGLGVMVSFVLVLILSWLFLKFTAKLPITKLFKFSSMIIAGLTIILIGKGVHAIQETGIFSITAFPIHFRLDFLGLYPTLETLLSQLIVFILIMVLYQIGQRSHSKKPLPSPAGQEIKDKKQADWQKERTV